jgi:hypothetical protein
MRRLRPGLHGQVQGFEEGRLGLNLQCNTEQADKSFCSSVLSDKGYTVLPIGSLFPFDLLAWRNDPSCTT